MNYDEIFDEFKSCYVGKEIKKDIIMEKLLNVDDKEIIKRFVNNFQIKYSIKAEYINKRAEENFEEIQIIEININDYRAIYDIYGILLSIIPYPILAIFRYDNKISIATSNRILAEDKNNKGKIFTSYLIEETEISRCLKVDINKFQTMQEIYYEWISNIENEASHYERIDRIINIIEIGFHIKSEKVLEKLENYILKYCDSYNIKPKAGWKSKLEKYSDDLPFAKKIETHSLWKYLSENTFLKHKLEEFSDWNDFKEACAYNYRAKEIFYSQYNSKLSDNEEIYNTNDEYRGKHNIFLNYNTKTKVDGTKNEEKQRCDEEDYNSLEYEKAR